MCVCVCCLVWVQIKSNRRAINIYVIYTIYTKKGQKIGLNIGRAKIIETFWPVASAEQRGRDMHSGAIRQTDRQSDQRTGWLN